MEKYIGTSQRIDGKTVLTLPKGVTKQDFEDWINNEPHRKNLEFRELPEKWTSLEEEK